MISFRLQRDLQPFLGGTGEWKYSLYGCCQVQESISCVTWRGILGEENPRSEQCACEYMANGDAARSGYWVLQRKVSGERRHRRPVVISVPECLL